MKLFRVLIISSTLLVFAGCNFNPFEETAESDGPKVKSKIIAEVPNVEKKEDILIEDEPQIPTVIYEEPLSNEDTNTRIWPTVRLWKQEGENAPEVLIDKLGKLGEFPHSYRLTPDKNNLIVNLESKLQLLNLETKELKDIFVPKKQINDFEFTKDGRKIIIWDQIYASDDFEYYVHEYDLVSGESKELSHGDADKKYLFIGALRDDNKIMLLQAMGEASAPWYLDLDTGELKEVPGIQGGLGISFTPSGRYLVVSTIWTSDICNDFMGQAPSIYGIFDSVTGELVSEFGQDNQATLYTFFSPDETEVMYGSYLPPAERDQCNMLAITEVDSYYRTIINGETSFVSDPDMIFEEWGLPAKPIASFNGEEWKILLNGEEVMTLGMDYQIVLTY